MAAHLKPSSDHAESMSRREPAGERTLDPGAVAMPLAGQRPLYGEFFGLSESPFDLSPNPRFLFLAPRQREVLSNLRYSMAAAKGFTLLLGDAGTGKTTLVRAALAAIGETSNRYVFVSNPTLGRDEFYELLAEAFNLSPAAQTSKARFLLELQRDVEARHAVGSLTGLVVDEAQSMPYELLEEIRLLGNLESATAKLLNIVLSGQPELAERLNESSLRQLKQRVALRCELAPFTVDETAGYISGRLRIAGGSPGTIFTRETVMAIHEYARGIPRTINVLCDNALIGGFAAQTRPVPVDVVMEVCRDFDLAAPEAQPEAPARSMVVTSSASSGVVEIGRPTPNSGESGSVNPKRKQRFRFFA
ncbi:MAG: AAA family ATPase [Acidobacteria bacterium]|nr:AAA family ATPase [Acidobacteriota bacterium]